MASLLDARTLQGILQTLTRRLYYGDAEALVQLWGDDEEVVRADLQTIEDILTTAAQGYWDVAKLEEVFKRSSTSLSLSPECVKVFLAFWGNEREKIHSVMIKRSTWNGHFKKLSWRIDVKTIAKSGEDLNEPLALLELRTEDGHTQNTASGQTKRQIQFEMRREEIGELLTELDRVQAAISSASY